MSPLTRRERGLTVLVFVGALLAHVLPWLQYGADPFSKTLVSDALSYDGWARQIAADGIGRQAVFHQAPLLPVVLAAVYSLAGDAARWNAAIALQILLTSLALAGLVPLAKHFLNDARAGVAGAAIAILHGPLVLHSLKILPVALALATQAGALLALSIARRRASGWAAFGAGAALGIAALARTEVLLFAPIAAAAVALARSDRRGRAVLALLFVAGVLAGVSPATLHNLNQGDFVLVASSGGENLYIGNQRGADGDYTPLHPKAGDLQSERILAAKLAQADLGRQLLPSEVSKYWRGKALSEIAADPAGWLRLEAKKLGRMFDPGDPNDLYSLPLERSRYLSSLWLLSLPASTLLGAGLWGLVIALRRVRAQAWPLVAFVAVQALILLVFFVSTRLRLPFLFCLTPFAGLALLELLRLLREGRAVASGVAIAAIAALTVVGFVQTVPSPRDYLRLASVLSIQGRLDEGLAAIAPTLTAVPPYALGLDQAGWLLQKKRDFSGAAERYRQALGADLAPKRAYQTRTRLAMCLEHTGDLAGAAAEHDRAASSAEADAGTYYERAMFRLRRSDRDGAASDLRAAVGLDPAWPPAKEALARLTAGADR